MPLRMAENAQAEFLGVGAILVFWNFPVFPQETQATYPCHLS